VSAMLHIPWDGPHGDRHDGRTLCLSWSGPWRLPQTTAQPQHPGHTLLRRLVVDTRRRLVAIARLRSGHWDHLNICGQEDR
jgi:hypothetical protein